MLLFFFHKNWGLIMFKQLIFILIFSISLCVDFFAANELTIQDHNYGSKPGFIDRATLVIEPFGSHIEQSLYLEYSDHNQFTENKLEIAHRFELPRNAVVNDMWLWIGDSVMQAIMLDTWTARAIYDSIVAVKYDPAFLTKDGTQYEFKIYPLSPGGKRKVKIRFVTPTTWYGNNAKAELPLNMLLANNNSTKPLDILFRQSNNSWGNPKLTEDPDLVFEDFIDTLGYQYKYLRIDDISNFPNLNISFNSEFTDGYYINGQRDKSNNSFFQFGISPGTFFNIQPDSTSKNILFAFDFSGSYNRNLDATIDKLKVLLHNTLKPNDSFKLLISGNGRIQPFTNNFVESSNTNIDLAINSFANSSYLDSIKLTSSDQIIFCDQHARNCWGFSNIDSLGVIISFNNIEAALNHITQGDIVAAYDHGHDNEISQDLANKVIERLDTLFIDGGRFLTYYDANREGGKDKLGTHYINGLKLKKVNHGALTLFRNPEGNIGANFPESFTRNAAYFLDYNDPDVKIELMDENGDPCVISKKIGNGLIVVTGIWQFNDDGAMRRLLSVPLLGLNSPKNHFQLDKVLSKIKDEYENNNFSKVVLASNSDSLILKNDAHNMITNYLNSYYGNFPKFSTINLLGNELYTPAYLEENQIEYYGSGYFLKVLADNSNGIHFEKRLYDWIYIYSVLSPYTIPSISNLDIEVIADSGNAALLDFREVDTFPDPNKPRFFLGETNGIRNLRINISAQFINESQNRTGIIDFLIPQDTTSYANIIPSMLINEKIKDFFDDPPIDTAKIVELSMQYNLLTDFTALIALEPDQKHPFMKNPFDESGLTDIEDKSEDTTDSSYVTAYPNPFNSQTQFIFYIKNPSFVRANIYNILGQKVYDVINNELLQGKFAYRWNGRNNYGSAISSGFYVLCIEINDSSTGKEELLTQKLLYLK
jgi:hypothetical protein